MKFRKRAILEKSEFDEGSDFRSVGGARYKKFYRYASKYFKDYFDYIRKYPQSSYESYCNDLIKSEYTPSWVSVLEKDVVSLEYGVREIVAGRILEFFEIPVVCEKLVKDESLYRGAYKILSLDFIGENENFESLYDSNVGKYITSSYKLLEASVSRVVDDLFESDEYGYVLKNVSDDHKQKIKDKLIKDLCYSYLVRELLMSDWDFATTNMGVLINSKTHSLRMSPNYDLEKCLEYYINYSERISFDGKTCSKPQVLLYEEIITKQPEVWERFVQKFNMFIKERMDGSLNYEALLSANVEGKCVTLDNSYEKCLESGINRVLQCISEYENIIPQEKE